MASSSLVAAMKFAMPHGLVQHFFRSKAVRRRMLSAKNAEHAAFVQKVPPYSYTAAIEYHRARGHLNGHLVAGSIPEASLNLCARTLDELIPGSRPLIGLHIGNFLGISLSYFADYVRKRNASSIVMSIDPNIQHQGVENPQNHVIALVNHFGLQRSAMICVGYSMNKTVSNDGLVFVGQDGREYDPYANFQDEGSCENVLPNLCLLCEGRFDFVVIDGNHEGQHLRRELAIVRRVLRSDGALILDDVSDSWSEIKAEFANLQAHGWRAIGEDERVGILQPTTHFE